MIIKVVVLCCVAVVSLASTTPLTTPTTGGERQGRLLPIIFDLSEHVDDDHKITNGYLNQKFPNFPLPWSALLPPIQPLNDALKASPPIKLYEQRKGAETLGYYYIDPTVLMQLLGGTEEGQVVNLLETLAEPNNGK